MRMKLFKEEEMKDKVIFILFHIIFYDPSSQSGSQRKEKSRPLKMLGHIDKKR